MSLQKIDQLLQSLALQARDKVQFSRLEEAQQAIGGLELLIETVTRAGVIEYMNSDLEHTYEAVTNGLELINAKGVLAIFQRLLEQLKNERFDEATIYELEDRIVFVDFDDMYEARWAYVQQNYTRLVWKTKPD